MPDKLCLDTLHKHLICRDPVNEPVEELVKHLLNSSSSQHLPESHYQIDPRDGNISVFSTSRSARVHSPGYSQVTSEPDKDCPICAGNLTGVCHIQPLSEGASFITENLYPVVHPHGLLKPQKEEVGSHAIMRGGEIFGGHFLQWTSSVHDHDWHNMPLDDLVLTMRQLALLEAKLLGESVAMPRAAGSRGEARGYFSIFKNFGARAGASLSHGHQQILFSNMMSRSTYDDWRFYGRHCETYSDYILRENPSELMIRDYGSVLLLVPYFMQRPYVMQAVIKESNRSYLYHLSDNELTDLTTAMRDAIRGIIAELGKDGKPIAFNFNIHTGPGCGLYVEFLPRADTAAGLEIEGVWVCQALPVSCAERLRDCINFDNGY